MAYAHAVAGASVTTDRQEGLAQLYAAERQQMDNLCGCFWATLALRAAGIDADQDGVAVAAGAILPGGDPQTHVAPGATPRNDYRVELPVDSTPGVAGTAAPGVARAIENLSQGALAAIPVAGPWTADTVRALMDAAHGATLIANVRTGRFWGSHVPPGTVLAHLRGEDVEPPAADWDVGHFVEFRRARSRPRRRPRRRPRHVPGARPRGPSPPASRPRCRRASPRRRPRGRRAGRCGVERRSRPARAPRTRGLRASPLAQRHP